MPLKNGDERHVAQETLSVKARNARVPNQKIINYKMVLVASSTLKQRRRAKTESFISENVRVVVIILAVLIDQPYIYTHTHKHIIYVYVNLISLGP